jgi:hypothetical protein
VLLSARYGAPKLQGYEISTRLRTQNFLDSFLSLVRPSRDPTCVFTTMRAMAMTRRTAAIVLMNALPLLAYAPSAYSFVSTCSMRNGVGLQAQLGMRKCSMKLRVTSGSGMPIQHSMGRLQTLRLRGGSYEAKGTNEHVKASTSASPSMSQAQPQPTSWASIASQSRRGAQAAQKSVSPASTSSFTSAVQAPEPKQSPHTKAQGPSPTKLKAHAEDKVPEPSTEKVADKEEEPADDAYYFNSYSHFGIHEEMLKDEVRRRAFHDM